MQYSVVNKSVLNGDFRIDPEFYKKDYLKNDVLLKQKKILDMDKVFITDGEHGTPEYDKTTNIKYITAENIKEGYIQETDFNTISKEQDERNKRAHIQVDDILIYSVGAYAGLVAKAEPHLFPCSIPRSVAIMRLSQKEISDFIVIFLNSKYGKYQMSRLQAGNAQPVLALEKIKELNIPLLSKALVTKVRKINKLAYISRLRAKKQYKTSEKVLLQSLDMLNFQCSQCKSYIKNFSDVQTANRLDAEYFQPKYDEILEIINRNNHTTLIKQFDIIRNSGLEYDSEGKNGVIKTKQIKDRFIDFNVEDRTNQGDSNIIVKNQDVLFASMGVGSLGKANIYYDFENDDNYIIDSTLKIFRAKTGNTLSPEYLDVYLHSQLARELIYQNIVGSSGIISIYESYLQSLPIPIINRDAEEQIIENVNKAHRLNYQSKQLLEIAKHGVEKAIEENEEIAMQWIDEQLKQIGVTL